MRSRDHYAYSHCKPRSRDNTAEFTFVPPPRPLGPPDQFLRALHGPTRLHKQQRLYYDPRHTKLLT